VEEKEGLVDHRAGAILPTPEADKTGVRLGDNRPVSEASRTPPEFDLALAEAAAWVGSGPDGIGEGPAEALGEELPELDVEGDDPAVALRQTLGMFATGVTVITTLVAEQVHGMTANAFMSVSLEPPLVLISVDRRTKMCHLLYKGQRFAVSILAADQRELSDRFAGRASDAAPEPSFGIVHETPVVEGAAAHFVARIDRSYYGGDHSLFLGLVEYAHHDQGAVPLLFHGGQYGRLTAGPED
jgi:flavin reductase (DIM6/NTAB) family NADH-FMN oxidoreductase RutF